MEPIIKLDYEKVALELKDTSSLIPSLIPIPLWQIILCINSSVEETAVSN